MTDTPPDGNVHIPKLGKPLDSLMTETIVSSFITLREKQPDVPEEMILALVLKKIGERFDPIRCLEGEWKGYKWDVAGGTGDPVCPNGHGVVLEGAGIQLGWVIRPRE